MDPGGQGLQRWLICYDLIKLLKALLHFMHLKDTGDKTGPSNSEFVI